MYDVINESPFLQNTDDVVEDFRKRIRHYEMLYETIDEADESDYSFIKVIPQLYRQSSVKTRSNRKTFQVIIPFIFFHPFILSYPYQPWLS